MRHRRIISYILMLALTLGVLVTPGVGAFCAYADAPSSSDPLYIRDFFNLCYQVHTDPNQESTMVAMFSSIEYLMEENDPTFNIFINFDPFGNFCMMFGNRTNGDGFYGYGWTGPEEYQVLFNRNLGNSYFRIKGWCKYVAATDRFEIGTMNQTDRPSARRSVLDITLSGDPWQWIGTPFEFNAAGWKCYNFRGMSSGNANGYAFPSNIVLGSSPPVVIDYELTTFYMGSQCYLTIKDQAEMRNIDPEKEDLTFWLTYADYDIDPLEIEYKEYSWVDVQLIENPGSVSNELSNISPLGVYAINIQNFISNGFDRIMSSGLLDGSEDYGTCVNLPIILQSEEEVQQQQNIVVWNTFNTYIETYNTTHVVPQQLGDWLFGLNGSQLIPVSVNIPGELYRDATSGTAAVQHVWEWGGLLAAESGFNYSLFDTVIMGTAPGSGVNLRYFYDDSLNPMYSTVGYYDFHNILHEFDVVIVVPDSAGILNGYFNNTAYCGSSSGGVVYSSGSIVGNVVTGFAFITEKAIKKQQLWNFNDGITKLYKLEVDYIDSEDKWKDSFLLWSASIFTSLDSLGGKLNEVLNYIKSIDLTLKKIADNTDPGESNFWYVSLFQWVSQFAPTDNDFSVSLQQYDTNWDNFPELPAPTTIPLLPDISPTPLLGG